MEDNDLIIELDECMTRLEENTAQMLIAFVINHFNGKNVSYDYIRKMIMHCGGREFNDKDITECISQAIIVCNDPDMQDWIGHYVHPFVGPVRL